MPGRSWATTSTLPTSSTGSSAAAAPSRPSISPEPQHCGRRNQRQRRHRRWIVGCNGIPRLSPPGGVYTPINFPLASSTTAFGINDNGEIAGYYTDSAGNTHGFVYADDNFSTVDVAGAHRHPTDTHQERGTGHGPVRDALSEEHGLTGQ